MLFQRDITKQEEIETNPCKPTYLLTVGGIGYKFDDKFIE